MLNSKMNKQEYKKIRIKKNKILKPKIRKKVSLFARTCNKAQIWINEMQKELKRLEGDAIYHLLKAVLQSLRDQMSIHEAAHFSAQLPLILRGSFFEGWNPYVTQQGAQSKDDFVASVKERLGPIGITTSELEPSILVALNVIKKHISAGEIKDLVAVVDPSLKTFIESDRTNSNYSH